MRPLDGIKVVELGVYVAVPGLTRLFSDWGADVIKVEPPKGDSCRYSGAQARMPIKPDCNLTFSIANSGKKLIGIDLKTPEGLEVMDQLGKMGGGRLGACIYHHTAHVLIQPVQGINVTAQLFF